MAPLSVSVPGPAFANVAPVPAMTPANVLAAPVLVTDSPVLVVMAPANAEFTFTVEIVSEPGKSTVPLIATVSVPEPVMSDRFGTFAWPTEPSALSIVIESFPSCRPVTAVLIVRVGMFQNATSSMPTPSPPD